MIKNYKLFTEGILDKLKGPSYEDVLKNTSPNKLLKMCFNRLDNKGVEYALEHGANELLYNRLVEMKEWFLDLITDLDYYKLDKYPDSIYWKKNGEILFEQDIKYKILWFNYDKILSVFENKYRYNYDNIRLFVKNIIEEQLNLVEYKPLSSSPAWRYRISLLKKNENK